VFDLIFTGKTSLFVSTSILEEYQGVLSRKKFQQKKGFQDATKNLLESISDIGILIEPKVSLHILPDESDNKFLELALASQADVLITGNAKDFPLKQIENTKIFSPKEYWERYWN
jgi:putative PIN family toxin of toxin-antitoxin system